MSQFPVEMPGNPERWEDFKEGTPKVNPNLGGEWYFWHELNELRDSARLPKNEPKFKEKYVELEAKYGNPVTEDLMYFTFQKRSKKPVALFCKFKGTWGEWSDFRDGKQIDDGVTIQTLSTPHYRTWQCAYPGQYGDPPRFELDFARARAMIPAQAFSEIRDVPDWQQFLKIVNEAEDKRRALSGI